MSILQEYPRISQFLWFDSIAEEAVNFYLSVFKNSRRFGATGQTQQGVPLTIAFELDGQRINGSQRRSALQIHRSHIIRGALRLAGKKSITTGRSSSPVAPRVSAAG